MFVYIHASIIPKRCVDHSSLKGCSLSYLASSTPQLPFETPQRPYRNGDHNALNRGLLGGSRFGGDLDLLPTGRPVTLPAQGAGSMAGKGERCSDAGSDPRAGSGSCSHKLLCLLMSYAKAFKRLACHNFLGLSCISYTEPSPKGAEARSGLEIVSVA